MTDSIDGCNVLPETQFVGTRLRVNTTRVLSAIIIIIIIIMVILKCYFSGENIALSLKKTTTE